MGVILDTSIFVAAERSGFDAERFIQGREDESFGISSVTVAELLHLVRQGASEKNRLLREAYVEKIIDSFPVHNFDVRVARIYASIWTDLIRRGIKINAHDLMVASTAIAAGFSVATADPVRFQHLSGLMVEDVTSMFT
ncbi:MAG: PIN domain-containing protein [Pseudomonadota bacterium]